MLFAHEKEVRLPTDADALEHFVFDIITDFNLPADQSEDIYEAIATMIMHLDNRIGTVKRSYFANGAVKFLANKAAFKKLEEFNAKRPKPEIPKRGEKPVSNS